MKDENVTSLRNLIKPLTILNGLLKNRVVDIYIDPYKQKEISMNRTEAICRRMEGNILIS